MKTINMLSKADSVKGQGVGTAYLQQVELVTEGLKKEFKVVINQHGKFDITHIHSINVPFYFKALFHRKQKLVGSVHFLPVTLEKSLKLPFGTKKIFYKYVLSMYKHMDYLVTVNPRFIDDLESYGIPREKVTYIPNYISEEKLHPIPKKEWIAVRKKYNIDPQKFMVLSVGQLQKRKGVIEFIDLAKSMPDVEFVWAGGFSFGVISEGYEEIKKALKHPPKNCHFIGIIEWEEMNGLYNAADVMFQPSFDELFPMTILEAMNTETPLLLRDLDEYKPILKGYYLTGTNNEEFKQQIEKLQNDPQFRKKATNMSREGKKYYSKEHVLSQWKDFYEMVANGQ